MRFHSLFLIAALPVAVAGVSERRAVAEDVEVVRRWAFDSQDDIRGWRVGRGVRDLRIHDGRLAGRIEHPDAYIFAPAVRVPMDGLVVRVRWSCPEKGSGQCYYATDRSPRMGEDKVVSRQVPGGEMSETEFPLDPGSQEADVVLTGFRLDPFNGVDSAAFEIDEVSLVRLPSRVEIGFGPETSVARAGKPVRFRVWLRHLGGRRPEGLVEALVDRPGVAGVTVSFNAADREPRASCELTFEKPGAHTVRARVSRAGRPTHDLETSIVVGLSPRPTGVLLESRDAGVELLPAATDGEAVRAGRLWVRASGEWKGAGLLLPLVELTFEDGDVVKRSHPALRILDRSDRRLRLGLGGGAPDGDWRPELALGFEPDRGPGGGEVVRARATLEGPRRGRLLRFSGISVRRLPPGADPLDRFGVFGGIEFLEPGWRSSSDRAVGPRHARRWTPHPFKISLPVMAIEAQGVTTALLWNPLQEWARGRTMPAATFASPDFRDGRPDHLLQLFVPSVPDFVDENASVAARPFVLSGEGVMLDAALHVAAGEPVARAARKWYEHFGIPEAPPAPHDMKTTYHLIARCFGETVFWPEEKGWRHHWFLDRGSRYRPDAAAELILHAKETGDRRWTEATGLDADRPLIEVAGTLWDRARQGAAGAKAAARRLREDGTYAYRDSASAKERTRQHTQGRFSTLGEDGSTSLGTCAQGALPLLRHVLLTGDAELEVPFRRALQAMRKFRVPRGAQVWEVHKDIPDIRAAALAVEAFRIGYLVTEDPAYLDDAFYWADAGLPFLFSWRTPHDPEPAAVRTSRDRDDPGQMKSLPAAELFLDPRRQVNPYGTIPVLGTTFYVISWFGVIVQWCGLEWAWKVLELCELRDDPILRAAAEGVVRSGLQQTFDRSPWTGLYPDVWNLQGNWAGGALICPRLVVRALRAGGHIPQALRQWTRRAGQGPEVPLVHGWGEALSCGADADGWSAVFRFREKEPGEVLVARSPRPLSVAVGGREIGEAGTQNRAEGWRYDADRRLLGIRFVSRKRTVTMSIRYR